MQASYFGPPFLIQTNSVFDIPIHHHVVLAATIPSCPRTGHSDERLHRKIHRNNGQNHFVK
ncbi:hypothetical protein ISN45_Aa03g000960, partial [Arabidopsis thaliana x Arabidopsis arenosa]